MSRLLTLLRNKAAGSPPLGNFIPSCVFDMEATLSRSYAGDDWLNYEPTPADGEAKAEYDLDLDAGTAPNFVGSVGSRDAYFDFDGTEHILGESAITDLLKSLHKTTGGSDFTVLMSVYYVSGTEVLLATKTTNGINLGLDVYTLSSNDMVHLSQGNGAANVTAVSTAALIPDDWNTIGIAHKHGTNTTTFWLNNAISDDVSHTFGTTTTDASGSNLAVGAYGNGTFDMAAGSRIRSVSCFNEVLTDAQVATVLEQYTNRHTVAWTPVVTDGLVGLFDPARAGGHTFVGNTVTQYTDLSGEGNHLSVTGAPQTGTATVNGLNVMVLDGNDAFDMPAALYELAQADDFTILVVSKSDSSTADYYDMSMRDGTLDNVRMQLDFSGTVHRVQCGSAKSNQSITASAAMHVKGMIRAATSVEGFYDGVGNGAETASNRVTTSGQFFASNSASFLTGRAGTMLVYNRALSGAEYTAASADLVDRWAV